MFNWMVFFPNHAILWARFANVRLDMKVKERIEYHLDSQSFNASLLSHRPDPSLGYLDETTGSDVFDIIENYVDNSPYSLCGSFIFLVVKRYPNTALSARVLKKLRDHHVMVFISVTDTPSGGNNPSALFDVAFKTNGMCFSNSDNYMQSDAFTFSFLLSRPYQFIAQTFEVSGVGSRTIPFQSGYYWNNWHQTEKNVIFQNHARDDNFRSMNFTLSDSYGNVIDDGPFVLTPKANSHTTYPAFNSTTDYTFTIHYEYRTTRVETLQIKMWREMPTDWLPLP